MTTTLTPEDRTALVDSVRRLLADRCAEADVRRIMASDTGHDPALWRALADLGLPGLIAPESAGGAGLGPIELELVMEEAGAALLPAPLLSSILATACIGDPAIVDGSRHAAVAFAGRHDWTGRGDVRIEGDRLLGTARFVPDAAIAGTIVVVLDDRVIPVDASRCTITPLPMADATRPMADVTLPNHDVGRPIHAASRTVFDLAIVGLAGEQAGAARRLLDITVAYARERHQFGRAIGSFQAIKHMAADLLLEVESATSAARDAARQLAENTPEKDAAIALAAFTCADVFVRVARDSIQMHGGIAFTWDHPAHLYLRRARSAAQLYGTSDHWRDRYLTALEALA